MIYFIKVKFSDRKRWDFLTPDGGSTHLRVYAAMIDDKDKADHVVEDIIKNYPDVGAKVVKA